MTRPIPILAAACAAVILATGAAALTQDKRKLTTHFSHKQHIEESGLKCKKCHKTDAENATMPEFKVCESCHEGIDADKPAGKRANVYLKDGRPRWSSFMRQADEVKFAHKAHVAAKLKCEDCHAEMGANEVVDEASVKKFMMASCTECHDKREIKKDCKDCHKVLCKTARPKSHKDAGKAKWIRNHGKLVVSEAAAPTGKTSNQCALCHEQDRCQSCHEKTKPVSHMVKTWKGDHCKGCHTPLEKEGGSCAVCHKVAAHSKAPSPPQCLSCHGTKSAHQAGSNCRQCHKTEGTLMGHHKVFLGHPDTGGECADCHKT